MANINDLPVEVLRHIFLHLDPKSFLAVCHTSQYWRKLALWRYTLFWHIDCYLCDSEDRPAFYKFYNYVKNNFERPLEPCETSALCTDNADSSSASSTYTKYIESYSATPTAHPILDVDLVHDDVLIKFYQKLLKTQLLGRNLVPLYTLRLLPHFFSNKPHEVGVEEGAAVSAGNSQVTEYVYHSLDGSFLLIIRRGIDNYHFLYGYQLAELPNDSHEGRFIPHLRYYYCWNNDREVSQVVLSTDNRYLGVSYNVGYMEVHDLFLSDKSPQQPVLNKKFPLSSVTNTSESPGEPVYPTETAILFARQYPSSINYLAISANGEVLFIRSQRLGGLIVVNIQTGNEIDIPHYRLDLSMSLQFDDKVLMLSGWNETIIFGKATHAEVEPSEAKSNTSDDIQPKGNLWDYFVYHIQNNISSYVPVERAIALQKINAYLGFDCSRQGGLTVKVVLDEEELGGFKTLEQIRERGVYDDESDDEEDEDEASNIGESDNEKEVATGAISSASSSPAAVLDFNLPVLRENSAAETSRSTPNFTIMETNIATEIVQHSTGGAVSTRQEAHVNDEGGDEEDGEEDDDEDDDDDGDEEEDEEGDGKVEFPIFTRTSLAFSDLNYCVTQDGTRMAILTPTKIYIYLLKEDTIDDGFVTGYLPHRTVEIDIKRDIFPRAPSDNGDEQSAAARGSLAIRKFMFIRNDKLLLMTLDHIIVYDMTADYQDAQRTGVLSRLQFDQNLAISLV